MINGINMSVKKSSLKKDSHKAAERSGASKGIVKHKMVDKIDHAKHSSAAKKVMGKMDCKNVKYFDAGQR